MKKPINKNRPVLVLLLLAIYIFLLIFGSFLIGAIPILTNQKVRGTHYLGIIAEEAAVGKYDFAGELKSITTRVAVFSEEGEIIQYIAPKDNVTAAQIGELLSDDLLQVREGKNFFKIIPSPVITAGKMKFWMVFCGPVAVDGDIIGAAAIIRNLENVQESIVTYLILISLFYWLAVCLIMSTVRKQNELQRLRQNYVANVTHALKTPTSSVKILAEMLSDDSQASENQKLYAGMILRETSVQDHMIQEILTLSKIQSGGFDFSKQEIDISREIASAAKRYEPLCENTDRSLVIDESIAELPPLFTNRVCLRHVLEILLDNAVKYTDEDGAITISACLQKKHAVIRIKDDGPGIAAEDLPYVFERFYRAKDRNEKPGNGLGLAIAKELMDGLGEKIWVESAGDKGTEFSFSIQLLKK